MIDTMLLKYENVSDAGVLELKNILQNKSDISRGLICVRAGENRTGTMNEFLEIKKQVDKQMGENGKVQRLDIAFDSMKKLEENKELYRLFLYCFGLSTGKKVEYEPYNTSKGYEKCNLKINFSNYALTIYNCEDKKRKGNTRTEYRNLYNRATGEAKNIIIDEVEKYENILKEIIKNKDELIKQVEEIMFKIIEKQYKKNVEKYKKPSEFISYSDRLGFVLTKNVLKKTVELVGIKSKISDFVRNYRARVNEKGFKFATKKELEELCKQIIKENYKTLTE